MSRSRKKTAGWKKTSPFMKNYANRRIRRSSDEVEFVPGSSYKRYTDPYRVCDSYFLFYNENQLISHFKRWEDLGFAVMKKHKYRQK